MAKMGKCANYDFKQQKQPKSRMGSGGFANLPDKAFVKPLKSEGTLRDGIIDNFTDGLESDTGISENQR